MGELERRKSLRARPRSKGSRAEREVVDLLRAHGWAGARRNFQSGAQGGGDILGVPGVSIEVKHREALNVWAALDQCQQDASPTDLPLLCFRRNRTGWYAAVPLEDLLELLKLREAA